MAYIVLTITGWLAVIIVKKEWPERRQILFILSILAVGLFGYLAVDILLLEDRTVIPKGAVEILAQMPWKDMGMFFAMLLGMASKYLFDLIGEKNRRRITFNKWQFLKPFLVSPIIFGAILSQVPENISAFMLFLISYQNGFFWHTLLYKVGPEKE
ncbi:MAG: hypothetical protein MUF15_04180 [Acidobacteria bacterium]|jgi:hypothetical protein|nr:hypothetical protein [Acidobacteriota bacterium]